jgi:hypothetical protein
MIASHRCSPLDGSIDPQAILDVLLDVDLAVEIGRVIRLVPCRILPDAKGMLEVSMNVMANGSQING